MLTSFVNYVIFLCGTNFVVFFRVSQDENSESEVRSCDMVSANHLACCIGHVTMTANQNAPFMSCDFYGDH